MPAFLDRLIETHRLAEADIVGFTSMFYQTVASFAMARRIKAHNSEAVTVIGGAACEGEMGLEIARRVDAIDYVFSGPALVSFPEFVEKRLDGDVAGCDAIDGAFSKTNLGRCVATGGCGGGAVDPPDSLAIRLTGRELDINENIPLDYDSFLDRFDGTFPGGELRPMLMFETSRGTARNLLLRWGCWVRG